MFANRNASLQDIIIYNYYSDSSHGGDSPPQTDFLVLCFGIQIKNMICSSFEVFSVYNIISTGCPII